MFVYIYTYICGREAGLSGGERVQRGIRHLFDLRDQS